MSAPGEQEEQEILLRLGDILPRVPEHLLKPGPHDPGMLVCFSVEELAEKISRGRVSVPIERLAGACPEVFRETLPAGHEVQLPLQKLLEQIGLFVPKPAAANGIPAGQVAQARVQASRILSAAASAPPPEPAPPGQLPRDEKAAGAAPGASQAATPQPAGIAKVISTARQLFGFFSRGSEAKPVAAPVEEESKPEAADEAPQADASPPVMISVRALPIFRLMPAEALPGAEMPDSKARVSLPLAVIEPQIMSGHVEVAIEDFAKALPEELRGGLAITPGAKVWIPLDEVFQSLPPDHPFHMPLMEIVPDSEPEPAPATEAPESLAEAKQPHEAGTGAKQEINEEAAKPDQEGPEGGAASVPEPAPQESEPAQALPAVPEPPPVGTEEPPPEPAAARTPWMRGFQVPPPLLCPDSQRPEQGAPALEPAPAPAPTPEARRTVDFLASQSGIFAAAAFVEGAAFASADFPRKPDLDALRGFMGAFVGHAHEAGARLGWNRVLTIGCDQFHATAVVRERHFIVALHYERVLPSLSHDALVAAADDLGRQAPA